MHGYAEGIREGTTTYRALSFVLIKRADSSVVHSTMKWTASRKLLPCCSSRTAAYFLLIFPMVTCICAFHVIPAKIKIYSWSRDHASGNPHRKRLWGRIFIVSMATTASSVRWPCCKCILPQSLFPWKICFPCDLRFLCLCLFLEHYMENMMGIIVSSWELLREWKTQY